MPDAQVIKIDKNRIDISHVSFQSAISAPGILGGEVTLSPLKQKGIEIWLPNVESNFLCVNYKKRLVLVPIMNVKSLTVSDA